MDILHLPGEFSSRKTRAASGHRIWSVHRDHSPNSCQSKPWAMFLCGMMEITSKNAEKRLFQTPREHVWKQLCMIYLLRSIYSDFKCHCAMLAIASKHYMKSPIMKLKLYCQFQVIFHVILGLKILKFQIQRVWRLAKIKGLLASSYSYSFSNFIKDVGHADNRGRIHCIHKCIQSSVG